MSEEWILRVMLTTPNVSGRAMAEAFHLSVGSDRNMVSRESIGNIRSAFLELYKELVFSIMCDFVFVRVKHEAATGASVAATGISTKLVELQFL